MDTHVPDLARRALACKLAPAVAPDGTPLSDDIIIADARELRSKTVTKMSANGYGRLQISPDLWSIDYLLNEERILFGLRGDFESLREVEDPGTLLIDGTGRKFILISLYETLENRQFFLAAQIGHYKLHIPPDSFEGELPDADRYFPPHLIDPVCYRQASLYAFGLLVPQDMETSLIEASRRTSPEDAVTTARSKAERPLVPDQILVRHLNRITTLPAAQGTAAS